MHISYFAGESTISSASPLTPSELLITLHNIEDKTDMKSIIKGRILVRKSLKQSNTVPVTACVFYITAVGLCFAEKTIYTQEVLAVVLQQLMDKNPLPTLFMRTVSCVYMNSLLCRSRLLKSWLA